MKMCYMQCMRYCDKLQMGLCFTLFRKNLGEINFTTVFPHLKKSHFLVIQYEITFVVTTGNIRQFEKKESTFLSEVTCLFQGFQNKLATAGVLPAL